MFSNSASRIASKLPVKNLRSTFTVPEKLYSSKSDEARVHSMFNEQQAPYYSAKDVEFCPNRAKEVMQNNVEESTSRGSVEENKAECSASCEDIEHMEAYQANSSVSLHSVMQSNVPEPFQTREKAPTHLNMPGSSSTRDCKYLSGKMQNAHHSRQ